MISKRIATLAEKMSEPTNFLCFTLDAIFAFLTPMHDITIYSIMYNRYYNKLIFRKYTLR